MPPMDKKIAMAVKAGVGMFLMNRAAVVTFLTSVTKNEKQHKGGKISWLLF